MKEDKYTPGIYIPHGIAVMDNITSSAKMLYGALMGFPTFEKEGVWASRKFLGKLISKESSTISDLIKALKEANLIMYNGEKELGNNFYMRLLKRTPPNKQLLTGYGQDTKGVKVRTQSIKDNNINIPVGSSNEDKIRPCYYRFAKRIQERLIKSSPSKFNQYSPDDLKGQVAQGANTIDQLVRLDKYNFSKQVKPALEWGIGDEFWGDQIRSLAPLRVKGNNNETKFTNIYDG